MTTDVAVIAVVAADIHGLANRRLRLHNLRGSSALAYECDVAVILNDKSQAVSKVHLAYDPVRAATFKHQVVFTVEKNRGGQAHHWTWSSARTSPPIASRPGEPLCPTGWSTSDSTSSNPVTTTAFA